MKRPTWAVKSGKEESGISKSWKITLQVEEHLGMFKEEKEDQ